MGLFSKFKKAENVKKISGEETKIETKTVRTSKFRFNNKVRRAN